MANQVTACNFLIPAYRIDCATGTPAISSRLDEYLATFCHIVEGVDSAAAIVTNAARTMSTERSRSANHCEGDRLLFTRLERHVFEPIQLAQWTRVADCLLVDLELYDSSWPLLAERLCCSRDGLGCLAPACVKS